MSRSDLASRTCTLARAIALVGDAWTLMILRELFLGKHRFDDFLRQSGMSSHLLAQRLKKLETEGVVQRRAYSERPPRYEYGLTEMGLELWPVVVAMKQWGDRWLSDGEPSVELVHKGCGKVSRPRMTCSECGEVMTAHDADVRLSRKFEQERRSAGKHA